MISLAENPNITRAVIADHPPPERVARDHQGDTGDAVPPGTSPLLLDGWLEFNRLVRDVEPRRFHTGVHHEGGPVLDAVVYLDPKGRVTHPWRNPYLPVSFTPTSTGYPHRIERQWHDAAAQLVGEMRERGVVNTLNLPPNVEDVRPWLWAGFRLGIRYTYMVEFPFDRSRMAKSVRGRVRNTERSGVRVERTTNLDDVYTCLHDTEVRQGYRLGVTRADLELARELLGDDHLVAHAAYAPNGEVASATVSLHVPGSTATGWVGGTRTEHLRSGAADVLELQSWECLAQSGAIGIDLCGANIPTIAAHKATLGARQVPYYTIESYSVRRLASWTRTWWRFRRQGNEGVRRAAD